jgi:hypothetical protein
MPRQKLYPEEELVPLSIRLPATMREKIQERAQSNRRSLNQEIIWLLEKSLKMADQEPRQEGK